jgi:fatty acid synthase subunit beta
MLYLNSHQWNFQFPLVLEYARAGYPIQSITIGAGVPSPDKAEEIFAGLQEAGIGMIGFKPGSVAAIGDVLELARLNPSTQVMLQWTSGRGGGHHSFEDFHQPLLETYASIRECPNVLLVVGSGFGDAEGILPYLTGAWSQGPGYERAARMPVDGVLFGSRCMVAKEAATSPVVKQLIVGAPGLEDEKQWDRSYDGDAGGVVTVQSELGEPIHKIHTRGMRVWKRFDEKYFSLPRGPERTAAIIADKADIIRLLNADFQKVHLPVNASGEPCDLEDMSYAGLLQRMIELMYVRGGGDTAGRLAPNRWIDVTYRSRTFAMMQVCWRALTLARTLTLL